MTDKPSPFSPLDFESVKVPPGKPVVRDMGNGLVSFTDQMKLWLWKRERGLEPEQLVCQEWYRRWSA